MRIATVVLISIFSTSAVYASGKCTDPKRPVEISCNDVPNKKRDSLCLKKKPKKESRLTRIKNKICIKAERKVKK